MLSGFPSAIRETQFRERGIIAYFRHFLTSAPKMEDCSSQRSITSLVEEVPDDPPLKPYYTSHRKIYLATLAAQLYIMAMGMVSTYSSPACADMKRPGSRLKDITADEITWIASLPMLSGIFGNAFSGYACHRFGRKATLMYLSFSFTLSWLLIAYAPSVPFIYAGRIICGLSTGMCTVAVPTYVVEISTVEIRGLVTSTFQVAVALGAFTMTGFGIILRWSWLAILGSVVVISGACLLYFMPESPPWLVKVSRKGEAIRGIRFLKGKNCDTDKELKDIAEYLAQEPKSSFSLKELLNPGLYKPLLIAIVLMFNMTFCGFAVILSYSVEIVEKSGSKMNPYVAATIIVFVQVIATIVSSFLMDRAGRKTLYIISGITTGLILTILGAYSYVATKYQAADLIHWTWVPVFCLVAYIVTFSLGLGSIPFVVAPELVPTAHRSFVMAVATFFGSLFGFISTKIYDDMQNSIGIHGTYWTYGIFSFIGAVFYWIFVPETKGRTIQDINESFSSSKDHGSL